MTTLVSKITTSASITLISMTCLLPAHFAYSSGNNSTIAPTVILSPVNNAIDVQASSSITAHFNKDIIASSLDNTSFTVANSTGTVAYNVNRKIATYTPTKALNLLTHYTASLTSDISDLYGNTLAPTNWSFTTRDGVWGNSTLINFNNNSNMRAPKIVTNASGNAIAIWENSTTFTQYDLRAMYYNPVNGWSTTYDVISNTTTGIPNNSQIAVNKNGDAIAVWQQNYRGTNVQDIMANKYTPASGWGTATRINIDGLSASHPQIAINNNADAIVIWQQKNVMGIYQIMTSHSRTTSNWTSPKKLSTQTGTANAPQIALDDGGDAFVTWVQASSQGNSVLAFRHYTVMSGWGTTVSIGDNQGSVYQPKIVIDSNSNAIAVWLQSKPAAVNKIYQIWSNRYIPGSGWGSQTLISDSSTTYDTSNPEISLDGAGNANVIYLQLGISINLSANHYNVTTNQWGIATVIENNNSGYSTGHKIVSDANGNALVVWSKNIGTGRRITERNIWASRYRKTTGWTTPEIIETSTDSVWNTTIAVSPNGKALALWENYNGTQFSLGSNLFE